MALRAMAAVLPEDRSIASTGFSAPENPTPGNYVGGLAKCQLTVFHETADRDYSTGYETRIS